MRQVNTKLNSKWDMELIRRFNASPETAKTITKIQEADYQFLLFSLFKIEVDEEMLFEVQVVAKNEKQSMIIESAMYEGLESQAEAVMLFDALVNSWIDNPVSRLVDSVLNMTKVSNEKQYGSLFQKENSNV